MLKIVLVSSIIAFSIIALAQDSSPSQNNNDNNDNDLAIPGKYLNKGQSVTCGNGEGCVIMTPKELSATANAIYRKTLEMHTCGLKSTI